MFSAISEKFEGSKVTINIQYDLVDDIHDYKTILNHIESNIEYKTDRPVLIEKLVDHGSDVATYKFTANVI